MLTTDNVSSAKLFLNKLVPVCEEMGVKFNNLTDHDERSIRSAVRSLGLTDNVIVTRGATRITIVYGHQFVVKMDYNKSSWFSKDFGNCKSELAGYKYAMNTFYEYLFAEIRRIRTAGHYFYLMEYCYDVDDDEKDDIYDSDEFSAGEIAFIESHFHDIHVGNYGHNILGSPLLTDYAANDWRR